MNSGIIKKITTDYIDCMFHNNEKLTTIEKYEDILSDTEYHLLEFLLKNVVRWGMKGTSQDLNGVSSYLPQFWYADLSDIDFFTEKMFHKIKSILGDEYYLNRVYANGQTFGQDGDWHQDCFDGTEHTFLYYFTKSDDLSLIGETYFNIGGEYQCIIPKPNSGIFFNGILLHKGMSPKRNFTDMRISIAFKMTKVKNKLTLL
jgi:hypothetical protein